MNASCTECVTLRLRSNRQHSHTQLIPTSWNIASKDGPEAKAASWNPRLTVTRHRCVSYALSQIEAAKGQHTLRASLEALMHGLLHLPLQHLPPIYS